MPGQGTFGHLMGGYDAGYYGYMYSLVFAADMYATVFKKNPLDPKLGGFCFFFSLLCDLGHYCWNTKFIFQGKLYRDKILLPGGSRDEAASLKVRILVPIPLFLHIYLFHTSHPRIFWDVSRRLMRSSRSCSGRCRMRVYEN